MGRLGKLHGDQLGDEILRGFLSFLKAFLGDSYPFKGLFRGFLSFLRGLFEGETIGIV